MLVLLLGCLIVLRPFATALIWAVILCVSSWPFYQRLVRWDGNRPTLAALIMAVAMVLIILVPFFVVGTTVADNVRDLTISVQTWIKEGPPPPPEWLGKVPLVGQRAVQEWQSLAADTAKLWGGALRFVEPVSAWLLKAALALGGGLLELALSILIAFFLFRDGDSTSKWISTAVDRIGGEQGKRLLTVAGDTVRGVVYGILGTALVQAILIGIGFWIAGVPGAALVGLMTFFVSVIPVLGIALVWIPAVLWLFYQGSTAWAIFLIIWGVVVGNIEHVIKPWLVSKGSHLPFLLLFLGLIGGALTFGFIGVFLGPTLLAVGFNVIKEWSEPTRGAAGDVENEKTLSKEAPTTPKQTEAAPK